MSRVFRRFLRWLFGETNELYEEARLMRLRTLGRTQAELEEREWPWNGKQEDHHE